MRKKLFLSFLLLLALPQPAWANGFVTATPPFYLLPIVIGMIFFTLIGGGYSVARYVKSKPLIPLPSLSRDTIWFVLVFVLFVAMPFMGAGMYKYQYWISYLVTAILIGLVAAVRGVRLIMWGRTAWNSAAGPDDTERSRPFRLIERSRPFRLMASGILVIFAALFFVCIIIPEGRSIDRLYKFNTIGTGHVLKNLKIAQENYYVENNTYADNLEKLSPWFTPERHISVVIKAAGPDSWSAVARQYNSTNWWTYSSSEGGMQ